MNDAMVCGGVPASGGPAADHSSLADSLDAEGLLALLSYEKSHGNRGPIVQALTERLAAVRSGTEPAGPLGDQLPSSLVE
ncbi:hypothetical protein [Mycetocola sp.]|uniref:hypothetical protein n=1 Tax=Mycetocola sp. TaxID=1871042 RepID=UPI0039893B0D